MVEQRNGFQGWFQAISHVAIIFGLGLVVYELNQSKQLAWAQMAQEYTGRLMDHQIALMGDDPRLVMARAALHPHELSESDAVALQALYEARTLGWFSMYRAGEIMGEDRGWRDLVVADARTHFSTIPGRRWLEAWVDRVGAGATPPDHSAEILEGILSIAIRAMRDAPGNHYAAQYEMLLAKDESSH